MVPATVHRQLGMSGLWLHGLATLAMGVPDPVPDGSEVIHHGLAVSQNRLEYPFLVLVWRQVELFGSECPQLR